MKDAIVLKDLEQIKAISQQYRLDVIDAFDNLPKTAKQVAEIMGEPHGRVNYHIKMLEKVGILELVEEVSKLGVVEKYYCPVAYKILIDSSAVTLDDVMDDTISKVSLALFESVSKDFYESIELYTGNVSRKIAYSADYFLTETEAKTLNHEISRIVEEFLKDKTEPKAGADRYTVAHMLIPMPAKKNVENS
jgi:DNA-binding transcriptional ArsR family regulator